MPKEGDGEKAVESQKWVNHLFQLEDIEDSTSKKVTLIVRLRLDPSDTDAEDYERKPIQVKLLIRIWNPRRYR